MSKEEFDAHKEKIMSIADDLVKDPTMPVSVTIQMAENLAIWAKNDVDELVKAGLNASLLDELTTRGGALRYIQAEWMSDKNTRSEYVKKWKTESPEGFELNATFEHYFRFAFYNQPDLLKRVDEIAANSGNADMIQDLMDYAALGKDNQDLLEKVGFDNSVLLHAETLANSLAETLAYNNNDQNIGSELKNQRDRAFNYLYEAIREVNRVGQFVFWRNPDRKKGYVNTYK